MLKKWISVALTGFLMMIAIPTVSAGPHTYEDVPPGSEYYYPVDYLRRNDVFKDTLYFYPDLIISKAEFIKYLVILNSPDFRPSSYADLPFEDTRNSAWYASYFEEAIDLGILDDRQRVVEPDKKLTVIDALTLLFHSQSIPIPNVYCCDIPYTDVARNTSAAPLIMRSLQLDLIRPMRSDYVGIYQRVTRAEAARMIYKLDLASLGTATSNGLPGISNYGIEEEKILAVWELIQETYLEKDLLDNEELVDQTLRALVDALDDPYSSYLDQEDNRNFLDDLDGQIEGIGAVIGFNELDEVVIISPLEDSPAMKAGLKAGDVILGVDGQDIDGLSLEEVVLLIKGPQGTTVNLRVRTSSGTRTITVTRDVINIPSLETELISSGQVMYADLSQFNYVARDEFDTMVDQIKADPSIRGLIVDLRNNPGGLLDVCLAIVGHFLEDLKEVVTISYADYTQVLLNRGDSELLGLPLVILIDGGSASASEIMAGTLQDYGAATIVGEQSFGKGTVQEVSYFVDDSSLKLTVAKWLTPLKQDIHENGITPDVIVSDNPDTQADEQLDRALQELIKLY